MENLSAQLEKILRIYKAAAAADEASVGAVKKEAQALWQELKG